MPTFVAATVLALALYGNAQLVGRGFPDCQAGSLRNNSLCNTLLDPLTRAKALISAFTLEEKLNNTGSISPGVPRLGLPAYTWWNEGLHGVASSPGVNFSDGGAFHYTTSFPQPILMGPAFDDELIEAVATVISTEARAFNNFGRAGLDFWTPNINPFRDPRWGRGQETPGEDPFHLSSYVHALITGLQGGHDSKYKRVVATCKHFVAYDMESWNGNSRNQWDAHINSQDLVEYYMPSFKSCARDSNVGAFMCSYNALNGVPTCADPWLLQDVLRDHWQWTNEQQWVTSDCDAVQNVFLPHGYTATREQAHEPPSRKNLTCKAGIYYQTYLPKAYSQGLVNDTDIDTALVRQYSSLVRLGYFDGAAVPYRNLTWADVNTHHAQYLAYKAAVEGIKLLKNDGTLPLKINNGTRIALIGEWANATAQMQGNYAGNAPYLHSPLYAALKTGAIVSYVGVPGGQGDPTTDGWRPLVSAAEHADIIIYAGGIDNSVEAEGMDRNSISWTGGQLDVIGQLAEHGKPMVVLQMGGGQVDSSPLVANANIRALVWGGYPGQDGGVALFDIIQGNIAPAGRLPVTQYPANYTATTPMTDMSLRPSNVTDTPGRTYQWYTGKPVFEFGHGLHYTNFTADFVQGDHLSSNASFSISSLLGNCSETYLDKCPYQTFNISVQNNGSVTSDYVTLGFLSGSHGPMPYPNKRLVAYQRLHDIEPSSNQIAELTLSLGSLARVDDDGNTVLYPGSYELAIDTQPLAVVSFTLTGSPVILDKWPQPPATRNQTSNYFVGGYGSL